MGSRWRFDGSLCPAVCVAALAEARTNIVPQHQTDVVVSGHPDTRLHFVRALDRAHPARKPDSSALGSHGGNVRLLTTGFAECLLVGRQRKLENILKGGLKWHNLSIANL